MGRTARPGGVSAVSPMINAGGEAGLAVVDELQRDAEVGVAQYGDDGLEVVPLLRRDPDEVALDRRLDALRPVGLDPLDDGSSLLVVDALPDRHVQARGAAGGRLRVLVVECLERDAA